MCVCSFDTFNMHRHYSPQLFWATFDTFDIQSITALIVYIELLLTPLTYIAFWSFIGITVVFHTFDTSNMPFDLLLIVQYLAPLTPLTSKSHSIYNVDSNSKYSN